MQELTRKGMWIRSSVIIILLVLSCLAIYFFHAILDTHEVFTHFFYIPIIIASIWWRRKGLYVALFLALILIVSHYWISSVEGLLFDFLRSCFFISAGVVTDTLVRHIALARDAVATSKNQYQNLYESAPDIYITIAPNGIITNANATGAAHLGYSRDRLIGQFLWTFVHEFEATKTRRKIQEIFEQKTLQSELESLHVRSDGEVVWLNCRTRLILDERQTPVQLLIACRDVTERRRTEDALREAEAKYSTVVEQARDGVLIIQNGAIIFANGAILDMLGGPGDEIAGRSFLEILSPEYRETACEIHSKRFKGDRVPEVYEAKIIRKDGAAIDVEISERLIQYQGKPAFLGCVRDISERKELEAERLRASKLESLGLLAGGIGHDFNNILTGILGSTTLAKMYAKPGESIYARLEDVERASLQARDLTQQLLTVARGGVPIKRITSIAKVIQESCRFALRGSRTICNYVVSEDLWPVEADEGQIRQVISNIIINADQAMPGGGVIAVKAENVAAAPEGFGLEAGYYLKISITDQGAGIPKEDLPKVFDPYFTTKPTGTGLGLATAYSIVKNHGGHIGVNSEVGIGTTVFFYLPASPERPLPPEKPSREIMPGKGRILLMDDEETVRRITGEILVHIGYEVEYARDGDEAIKLYQEAGNAGRPFDAVILDMTVPGGKGGKEAIKNLLEADPSARVIISSGYANDPIMITFEEYGFKGAIAKPYEAVELSRVLHAVMTEEL